MGYTECQCLSSWAIRNVSAKAHGLYRMSVLQCYSSTGKRLRFRFARLRLRNYLIGRSGCHCYKSDWLFCVILRKVRPKDLRFLST